jgi:threonyl-tRNA synthetase
LPQLFGLDYVGQDNNRHQPVMIHRALFGSIERFMALLLEHYAGAFPTWLAPVQVRVLPVRDDHIAYAAKVRGLLQAAGVRVEADDAAEPLGARIRRAKLEKIPYILVVGDSDVAQGTVGVNARGSDGPERGVSAVSFVERLRVEAAPPVTDVGRRDEP